VAALRFFLFLTILGEICVYEGKDMEHVILPKPYLFRHSCPVCGFGSRKVDTETKPTLFERGTMARWPFGWPESRNRGEEASAIASGPGQPARPGLG
jgi:hypothetical protein